MILDWLAREGWLVFSWWLLAGLAGAAALPLAFRMLRSLPDSGYTLARALGLLLTGFIFWLGASLGFLTNTPGSMLLAWLLLAGCSIALFMRRRPAFDLGAWWRSNRRFVLLAEGLFLLALLAMALLRAHNPGLHGTEKPMELAFLSATQRSAVFPPADPWFSGHAISYYYFGYVLLAMLATLSGSGSTVAFNLGISLLFALGALTAYGVAGNLARSRRGRGGWRSGLLAAGFVTVIGNWQLPLIEFPWQAGLAPDSWFAFWGQHTRLAARAFPAGTQVPVDLADWDFWWWFRASRVLTDRNLDGSLAPINVISEFPAFSHLLADVHPHVLALPFVLLVTGLALALVLSRRGPGPAMVLLCGLAVGGVTFLNAWDGPLCLLFLTAAEGLRRLLVNGDGRLRLADLRAAAWFGLRLALTGALCYLPFFLSFRTQAGGFLPNLQHPSALRQLFLVFAPFALILGAWLLLEWQRAGAGHNRRLLLGMTFLVPPAILLLIVVLALVGSRLTGDATSLLTWLQFRGDAASLAPALLTRRVAGLPALLALCGGLGLVLARLFPRRSPSISDGDGGQPGAGGAFALLLTGTGLLLVLVPEFLFLQDVFSSRSNTIFKFYYHAWLLFSVAAAWAVGAFWLELPQRTPRRIAGVLALCAIVPGMSYPLAGIYTRAFVESGRLHADAPAPLTLDGGPGFIHHDDYAAIRCLEDLVGAAQPVVAEAYGSSYDNRYGRVGTLTGMPVVLNWEGHQRQWRGAAWNTLRGNRAADLDRLYQSRSLEEATGIIDRYDIEYVLYGESERMKYGDAGEAKFHASFAVPCESGESRFYRVAPANESQRDAPGS